MTKRLLTIAGACLCAAFLAGCNDTIDDPETNRSEMEEENVNEADEMRMDDEMDEIDLVDEDSLNKGGRNGEHKLDINEDGKLNGNSNK